MFTDDLINVFKYDAITGVITRLVRTGNYQPNTECNSLATTGYIKVTYKGQQFLGHRLAWFLYYKEQPPEFIDHIDLDKTNNRITNLRAATNSQNQMNIKVHKRSKTGIKGIMPVRGGKSYRAEVCVDGVRYQKQSKNIAELETWLLNIKPKLHGTFAAH